MSDSRQQQGKKSDYIVIALISLATAGGVWFIAHQTFWTTKTQNIEIAVKEDATKPCVPIKGIVSDKTVILRVDDIQPYAWQETTRRMITDAEKYGIPLTLAVIPKHITDDAVLIEFLKNRACTHEFGLHGWDHRNGGEYGTEPEFGKLSKAEATERIIPGVKMIERITKDPVLTWVPPLNVQSVGTTEALGELGFTYISTEGKKRFDYDATTFNFVTSSLVPPETVALQCEEAFRTDTICIIMLHPQDFANGVDHNEEKYNTYYINLIELLRSKGYTFARFKDIPL